MYTNNKQNKLAQSTKIVHNLNTAKPKNNNKNNPNGKSDNRDGAKYITNLNKHNPRIRRCTNTQHINDAYNDTSPKPPDIVSIFNNTEQRNMHSRSVSEIQRRLQNLDINSIMNNAPPTLQSRQLQQGHHPNEG